MPYLGLDYFCQNSETPEFWYRLAATQGKHPHAQYCYAISILNNRDRRDSQHVEEVKEEAMHWLREAATKGITSAAFMLYHIANLGLWGIDIDGDQADYWLHIAKQDRAQFNERQQYRKTNKNCAEPEDWELDFHKDSIFIFDEKDLKKWNQYIRMQT